MRLKNLAPLWLGAIVAGVASGADSNSITSVDHIPATEDQPAWISLALSDGDQKPIPQLGSTGIRKLSDSAWNPIGKTEIYSISVYTHHREIDREDPVKGLVEKGFAIHIRISETTGASLAIASGKLSTTKLKEGFVAALSLNGIDLTQSTTKSAYPGLSTLLAKFTEQDMGTLESGKELVIYFPQGTGEDTVELEVEGQEELTNRVKGYVFGLYKSASGDASTLEAPFNQEVLFTPSGMAGLLKIWYGTLATGLASCNEALLKGSGFLQTSSGTDAPQMGI